MWASMWPDRPEDEVPVGYITNGVHVPTWISSELASLFSKYLGSKWLERQDDPAQWDAILNIPDEELWAVRQNLRRYLFTFVRERARQRWTVERVGTPRVVAAGTLLEPEALTIGFARRFTGYKRPELIFNDSGRLAKILSAPGRPVQIIFAGKSHPADETGKHHLQRVYRRALDPVFGGRIAFVDDYDLHVAHYLVQGCDVWLNNPRKPLEASGTSGMKAALNGVPHLSIGDGWWAEGYNNRNGWLIDGGASGEDFDVIDAADAKVVGKIDLGGGPEFAVADGNGFVFNNLEDESQVLKIDSHKLTVQKRWPTGPCQSPSSMAMDKANRRLFIGCRSRVMAVMNADTGEVIMTLPIGDHVDATAFDPETRLIFNSNGEGTVSVIRQETPDKYSSVQTIKTLPRAKTMALDAKTHRLFLPTAEAGQFEVLVVGKAD